MAHILRDRVMETSATTGTGAFTLGGAYTGYRTFASVMSTNDTTRYAIIALDSNGNDSGDWEVGTGTYSGINTLTRTTVEASSNSGSAVNFSAGNKRVMMGASATLVNALAPAALTIITDSGTSRTLALTDAYCHIRFTSGSAVTLTVPPNNSVAFPTGTRLRFTQAGAGVVTLTPGSGVTLNSRNSLLASAGQYAVFEIEKVATNEWDVIGDVA